MKKYKVTDQIVIDALKNFEAITYKRLPCHLFDDGYCEAEIFEYDEDDEFFDIELIWGIHKDDVNTDLYLMDKVTLDITEFFEE